MQKIFIAKIFGAPLQTAKNFRAPLFAMKITGQPHRKACKLNFYWKICGNFFQGPPYKGQKFQGPPFLHQAPPPLQVFVNGPQDIDNHC